MVKVYVSVFGDERGKDVAIAGLKSKAKYVRCELGKRMKLRLTPEIRFIEDESLERGSRVSVIMCFFYLVMNMFSMLLDVDWNFYMVQCLLFNLSDQGEMVVRLLWSFR